MSFLGIDPGQSGGIAVVINAGQALAYKMPDTERDVFELLAQGAPYEFAMIEAVHSMPKQGVASSFKFGRSYGFLRGILTSLGIPWGEVSPQRWQKHMQCRSGGDKNITKAKAQQLFPGIKITHAVADSLLIAEYCRQTRY